MCCYFLLQVRVPKEETGMVSDLRYGWRKLRKLATDTSDNLARQQVRAALNNCRSPAASTLLSAANCVCVMQLRGAAT
jgi:hypothetical protein